MGILEEIRSRVTIDAEGCWNWQGFIDPKGYGRFGARYAHRASFEAAKGPIRTGLQIDHLCRNRACCNPDHLEAVTPAENTRRGLSPQLSRLRGERKTHCVHGHAFTAENIYRDARGYRSCKECRRSKNGTWGEMRRRRRDLGPPEGATVQ